jgi:excisionase family DNA binding protein
MLQPVNHDEKLTVNVPEVAKLLGISRATAYALANSGQLPAIRLGRRLLVPRALLEQLLSEAGKPKTKTFPGDGKLIGKTQEFVFPAIDSRRE